MSCANTKGIFRIIKFSPSIKAMPFWRWLEVSLMCSDAPELVFGRVGKNMFNTGAAGAHSG